MIPTLLRNSPFGRRFRLHVSTTMVYCCNVTHFCNSQSPPQFHSNIFRRTWNPLHYIRLCTFSRPLYVWGRGEDELVCAGVKATFVTMEVGRNVFEALAYVIIL